MPTSKALRRRCSGRLRRKNISRDLVRSHSAIAPRIPRRVERASSFSRRQRSAQREFISHLAHANGYYIAWENVDQTDILQAAIESFSGDRRRLTALVRENL